MCRVQDEVLGLCSVQVIVNRPNGICVKAKEIIQTIFIPLGSMDWTGICYNYTSQYK